jgi:hypothetical protein
MALAVAADEAADARRGVQSAVGWAAKSGRWRGPSACRPAWGMDQRWFSRVKDVRRVGRSPRPAARAGARCSRHGNGTRAAGTGDSPAEGGRLARAVVVTPNGDVLPRPTAQALPLLRAHAREGSWRKIWTEAPTGCRALRQLRSPHHQLRRPPLPSLPTHRRPHRHRPVYHLSPDHSIITEAVRVANQTTRPGREVLIPRPHRGRPGKYDIVRERV